MLDTFLDVLAEREKTASSVDELTAVMKDLPLEEIQKIASGKIKLSYYDGDPKWLTQFEGTPLYNQAVSLEKELLTLEAAELEKRIASERDNTYDQKDKIRLKKKLLELQLAMSHGGKSAEEPVKEPGEDHTEESAGETKEPPTTAEPVSEKAASAMRKAAAAVLPKA
jgi:hypothetical protein